MSSVPTLLLSPGERRDRTGAVTPTLTGGVITVPGQYGDAWQVAEATTNLVLNPKPSDVTSVWVAAPHIRQLVSDERAIGGSAVKITFNGTLSGDAMQVGYCASLPAGATMMTASCYAWSDDSNVQFRLRGNVRYSEGASSGEYSPTVTLTSTPQRIVVTAPVDQSRTPTEPIIYGSLFTQNGKSFYVANIQVEAKPYATPYADGSLGAGHAWTGTANASASTRTGAAMLMNLSGVMNASQGAALIRLNVGTPQHSSTYMQIGKRQVGGNALGVTFTNTLGGSVTANWSNNATWNGESIHMPVSRSSWVTVYIDWNGPTFRASVNGGPLQTATMLVDTGNIVEYIRIGGHDAGTPANSPIESVLIFDTALADAEIERISTMDGPWTWESLMPKIGGVLRTHTPSPFALLATHKEL